MKQSISRLEDEMLGRCDDQTKCVLHSIVGRRVLTISAQRGRGYFVYNWVSLTFGDGHRVMLTLKGASPEPKFEVFVLEAREVPAGDETDCDRFELGSFVVEAIWLLERKEWISKAGTIDFGTVGNNPVRQEFGEPSDPAVGQNAVIVNSGIVIRSSLAAEIVVNADTFPGVFQFRYAVEPSSLPKHSKIPLC